MSAVAAADNEARVPGGIVRYREAGSGPPLVFIHGLLVNGLLWRKVVPELQDRYRCIVPEMPLGSHPVPMDEGADLSPTGLARLIHEFLAALDLSDVTLVANDTGGALSQIYATRHPERLGRLVLTNCDAYENFLPPAFRPLQWIARVPGGTGAIAQSLRVKPLRRTPLGFGMLTKRPVDADVLEAWCRPSIESRGIRRDLTKVLRGIDTRYTMEAAEKLGSLEQPALLAWAPEDRFFKLAFAERLAAAIPNSRLEQIPDSRTFISEDQPQRLAELIGEFAANGG
jgi:pimeloyl-ACP methyl ester carboxylesterase